ncbi:sulfurtransferase TusA family protein [Pseudoroseomonas globiformis]|uniref:Sulfurtransferase TusA family protein n=1 Tax=Teichococcus globiformis TaxID=2307229 RepID=A0ABV7FXH6_9PROT
MDQNTVIKEYAPDNILDITTETCPMTFVRTRLALDRLRGGDVLVVQLRGEEPRRNIPQTAEEQGHTVLQQQEMPDGSLRLSIRKGG